MQLYTPIITSYTNIASVFSIVKIDIQNISWFYMHYGNLCWDESAQNLLPCGFSKCDCYESLLDSPYLNTEILDKYDTKIFDKYLENNYVILFPINTNKLGITEDITFVHDIMINKSSNNIETHYEIYDFWKPQFVWGHREVSKELILNSIDFSNLNLYNKIIAFKATEKSRICHPFTISECITQMNKNFCFKHFLCGPQAYEYLIFDVLQTNDIWSLANTNFQILCDHFVFLQYVTKNYFFPRINHTKLLMLSEELLRDARKTRNYVMKIWYSNKKQKNWKEKIINKISIIQDKEKEFNNLILKNIK